VPRASPLLLTLLAGLAFLAPARARAAGSAGLVTMTTRTLRVTDATNSKNGSLTAADLARLQSSDDDRYDLRDREQLALAFEQSVPADAIVSAIRVFVEHNEQPRVNPGDVLWELGRGSLGAPSIIATTSAPLRSGAGLETLDAWPPSSLVADANDLKLVIRNDSPDDDTLLDRIYVEVDYTLPDPAPHVTSSPGRSGVVGQRYGYDADASGVAPIAWSLASGPVGFSIDATTGGVTWTPDEAGAFLVTIRAANAFGAETQRFFVEVLEGATLPATILPAAPAGIVYCPPERLASGPAAAQQHLNVFLPSGLAPPGGWPVVLNNRAGGGIAAQPLATLKAIGDSAPLHAFVESGVAVVDFGVTAIGGGFGLFYPPGDPSGRYESFLASDDNPEKEAEWAVQWLKTQSTFPLDPGRICLRGSSHGAIIAMWAALGPARARAFGSTQVCASTRVKAILALQPPTSVWAFDQGPTLASRMVAHYEQQDFPGVPATAFGQVAERLQKDSSVMGFVFESAEARAHAETQAICLVYADPVKSVGGAPADMTLDAQGFPNLHGVLGQPFIHDSWAGYVLFRRLLELSPRAAEFHRAHSVFAVRDTSALAPPLALQTCTFSGGIKGGQAAAIAHEWVLRTLGVASQDGGVRAGGR